MRGRGAGGCPPGLVSGVRAQGGLFHGGGSQIGPDRPRPVPSTPGSCRPTPAELAPYFPDLEILELLGRGGMGVVYKARQKRLDRLVALKILSPKVGQDPAFAERFAREARAMAMLNHPHIVAVYDFGQTSSLPFRERPQRYPGRGAGGEGLANLPSPAGEEASGTGVRARCTTSSWSSSMA